MVLQHMNLFSRIAVFPKDALLGPQGKGFPIAMHTLDGGRIGIAEEDEITWYSNNTLVALEAKHALEKSKIAWFSNNATL